MNFVKETEYRPNPKNVLFGIQIPNLPTPDHSILSPNITEIPGQMEYPWTRTRVLLQEQTNRIAKRLVEQSGGDPNVVDLSLVEPPAEIGADFAAACFKLGKPLRRSPNQIASEMATEVDRFQLPPLVAWGRSEGAYLNYGLDMNQMGEEVLNQIELLGNDYGQLDSGKGEVIVIDSSSPNVAKFMSVGHLRSTVIGESLSRIYRKLGFTVIRDNHLGDWGTQFGMLGRAYELWRDEIPELQDEATAVNGLYKLYVKIHEEVEREKEADPNNESTLEREGREWFRRLEEGDPKARELLDWSTTQSLREFQRVYQKLGVDFEYNLGESFYIGMLPDVTRSLVESGVGSLDEKGALTVEFEDPKMNRLVVQKTDGTSLYSTRDLATLVARTAWFNPGKILYVVGGDQSEYFKQVFKTFEMMAGDEPIPELEHVSFGMVTLPDGKMSTRKGRVVFLEEVIDESVDQAREKLQQTNRDLDGEEMEKVARQVGVGAVIHLDLGQGRERRIQFDIEHALSLEGNSAPYVQYAHARAESILRRADAGGVEINQNEAPTFSSENEKELLKLLARFPEIIQKAAEDNQPSVVAEYVLATANKFSQFYQGSPILVEEDAALRNTRLRLTSAVSQVLRNGLDLLGIESPAKM